MPGNELQLLVRVAVLVYPEELPQVVHHIVRLPVQVGARSRTEEKHGACGVVHLCTLDRAAPVDVLHVLERDERLDVGRDDGVVDVLDDSGHGECPLVAWNHRQRLSQRVLCTEQADSGRTGEHDAVVVGQQVSAVAFQQRETEKLEEVFLYRGPQQLHGLVAGLHIRVRDAQGAPVLYLGIAALQAVAQIIMSSRPVFVGHHRDTVGIGQVLVHGELARHHIRDKEHEHQRDAQAGHVDQCKELVALQKGKISFHVDSQ